MTFTPLAFFISSALFLFLAFMQYRQRQKTTKYRRQRDDLMRTYYNSCGLWTPIPDGMAKVLDEIEGKNVAPRK